MRPNLTLLAAATVLVVSMSAAYAAENAPGGTGVVQSTEGKGATNKDTSNMSDTGAGSMQGGGAATGNEPGTGVEQSSQGNVKSDKQGMMNSQGTNMGGASSGNAVGGTGIETSSQAEGATNKTTN